MLWVCVFVFCGWVPAYLVPEIPLELKGEPRALTAFPGVLIVPGFWHDWLGCPFIPPVWGLAAVAAPAAAKNKETLSKKGIASCFI